MTATITVTASYTTPRGTTEYGWLVCRMCHVELTHGGYLARFARMPEFRAFQAAVLERRRRGHPRPGSLAR